jgi:hypothetical protein
MEEKNREKQQEMLKTILNGSIIIWWHINLHGEYDFTATNKNASNFDLEKIMRFDVGR